MIVGEICTREVVVINGNSTIREAAKLMRTYHVGNVVVVEQREDENIPVGILTDRDIVLGLIAKDVDMDSVTVGDVMSRDLQCSRQEDDILATIKKMRHHGIRRILVVNERGGLEGLLAVDDLIDLLAEQLADLAALVLSGREREQDARP